jgi:hypothetical protein
VESLFDLWNFDVQNVFLKTSAHSYEISGFHGNAYEDNTLLGYIAM